MKTSEATRKLTEAVCYLLSHGGNHDWWYSPITKKRFQVPRHKTQELKPKTKANIEFWSGVKL